MNNLRKLKVGQIGVANFGAYRRMRLKETGLFDLAAAYDWDKNALNQCQREEGASPASSYEDLLSTPGLEAVIIATGAKYHAEQALAAIRRGLHVFVEKPLCSTMEEARALIGAQKEKGVVIGVGHHDHGSDPESIMIKRWIEEGEFGKVATFEETTAHTGGLRMKPVDWRADPLRNPGGMLFQCGVHAIHELMFYFGPVVRVSCMMRHNVHSSATADVAICHLEFASGLIGTLNAYHVTPYRHTLNIFGTRMNLYRELGFADERQLLVQRTNLDDKKEPRNLVEIKTPSNACGNLRNFYRAIREGAHPSPSLSDGVRAIQVVFAAEESAKTRRTVDVLSLI